MGISPGMPAVIVRRLPVQGNLYIRFGNRHVALRYEEAKHIRVIHA